MKDLLKAWTQYTARTGEIICDYIIKNDISIVTAEYQAFYPTIASVFIHLIDSDLRWMNRLAPYTGIGYAAGSFSGLVEAFNKNPPAGKTELMKIVDIRRDLDERFLMIADGLTEEMVNRVITIPFGKADLTLPQWKLMMQWLNHHTHHLGQISLMLEMGGIENDFSLTLDKIE